MPRKKELSISLGSICAQSCQTYIDSCKASCGTLSYFQNTFESIRRVWYRWLYQDPDITANETSTIVSLRDMSFTHDIGGIVFSIGLPGHLLPPRLAFFVLENCNARQGDPHCYPFWLNSTHQHVYIKIAGRFASRACRYCRALSSNCLGDFLHHLF